MQDSSRPGLIEEQSTVLYMQTKVLLLTANINSVSRAHSRSISSFAAEQQQLNQKRSIIALYYPWRMSFYFGSTIGSPFSRNVPRSGTGNAPLDDVEEEGDWIFGNTRLGVILQQINNDENGELLPNLTGNCVRLLYV